MEGFTKINKHKKQCANPLWGKPGHNAARYKSEYNKMKERHNFIGQYDSTW